MLQEYWANPNGFLPYFQNGVKLDKDDLGNFGSGDGAKFQFLSKYAPAFHAFVSRGRAALSAPALGADQPHEVELRKDANDMLLEVQHLLSEDSAESV